MRFENKVIIVTGGARGIGKAIAAGFAREGGKVIIADILEDEGAGTVKEITREGGRAFFLKTDVTRKGDVLSTVNRCLEQFGKIDVLVNNVGWDRLVPFKDTDEEFWDKIIARNYRSTLNFTRATAPHMIERKAGRIVNIGSDAGRMGEFKEAVYAGAKGAVIAFSKAVAREVARYGITVNVVCPGLIKPKPEEMSAESMWKGQIASILTTEAAQKAASMYPLRRLGTAQDIADAVAFLASDRASFITGQTLSVSGGYTMA